MRLRPPELGWTGQLVPQPASHSYSSRGLERPRRRARTNPPALKYHSSIVSWSRSSGRETPAVLAQLAERLLGKQKVSGSNPGDGSILGEQRHNDTKGRRVTSSGRLPNLVVIGVSKAGTTSLFEYLGRHPDVGLSDHKELRYFMPRRYGRSLESVETYAEHFRHLGDERYAIEATPGYFYGGKPLAHSMREVCQPKVVLSLREPVGRCWSWFRFVKSRLRIPKDLSFEDYLDHCEKLRADGVDGDIENQAWWGLGGGCYSEWLDDWIDEFGNDLKVQFFENLVKDPQATMNLLFDWLELDPGQAELMNLEAANATQSYRNPTAQRVAVSLNRRGERFFRRHPWIKRELRARYYALNGPRSSDAMSPGARDRLNDFYRPYNDRLADQLGRLNVSTPVGWVPAT
jgi:hypothetical protein